MVLPDEQNGIEIELSDDGDDFPLVRIDLGGGFYGENQRPTGQALGRGSLCPVRRADQPRRPDGRG
jgi:hypothetical protein